MKETLQYITTVSLNLVTAGILTLVGYLFRNKLKKLFTSNDLVPRDAIPMVSIESGDHFWGANNIKYTTILIENEGNISVSKIGIFLCCSSENSVAITPIKVKESYKWVNAGNGERVQFDIPLSLFDACNQDDRRIFVQMLDNKGVKYRRTVYLCGDQGLSPQATMRVRKMLPKKFLHPTSPKRIDKLVSKYSLDMSKG
jgi:hypothetical protein